MAVKVGEDTPLDRNNDGVYDFGRIEGNKFDADNGDQYVNMSSIDGGFATPGFNWLSKEGWARMALRKTPGAKVIGYDGNVYTIGQYDNTFEGRKQRRQDMKNFVNAQKAARDAYQRNVRFGVNTGIDPEAQKIINTGLKNEGSNLLTYHTAAENEKIKAGEKVTFSPSHYALVGNSTSANSDGSSVSPGNASENKQVAVTANPNAAVDATVNKEVVDPNAPANPDANPAQRTFNYTGSGSKYDALNQSVLRNLTDSAYGIASEGVTDGNLGYAQLYKLQQAAGSFNPNTAFAPNTSHGLLGTNSINALFNKGYIDANGLRQIALDSAGFTGNSKKYTQADAATALKNYWSKNEYTGADPEHVIEGYKYKGKFGDRDIYMDKDNKVYYYDKDINNGQGGLNTGGSNGFGVDWFKKGGKMKYFQEGGAMSAQQGNIEEQVVALVQAAMSGDQKAAQTIEQVMAAAKQGDQKAAQIAQLIQAVAQKLQGQAQAAKQGAKLNYFRRLQGQCPDGYEPQMFKAGGQLCMKCIKKAQEIAKQPTVVEEFYKFRCGGKAKKKEDGGIVSDKCGGKAKKKCETGGALLEKCGGKAKKKCEYGGIVSDKCGGKAKKKC